VGRWAIGLYLGRATQPTAYGAAASFAALLLWLYYSAQIFLFGAEFTHAYAHEHAGTVDLFESGGDARPADGEVVT
jgi:membrane protein